MNMQMTDVEIGGGTAFPSLGFSAKAAAGSMLFWLVNICNIAKNL